jgi:hypothetical protein
MYKNLINNKNQKGVGCRVLGAELSKNGKISILNIRCKIK